MLGPWARKLAARLKFQEVTVVPGRPRTAAESFPPAYRSAPAKTGGGFIIIIIVIVIVTIIIIFYFSRC